MKKTTAILLITHLIQILGIEYTAGNSNLEIDGYTKAIIQNVADNLDLLPETTHNFLRTIKYQMKIFTEEAEMQLGVSKKKVLYVLEDHLKNPEYKDCMQKELANLDKILEKRAKDLKACANVTVTQAKHFTEEILKLAQGINDDMKYVIEHCLKSKVTTNREECNLDKIILLLQRGERTVRMVGHRLSGAFNVVFTIVSEGHMCMKYIVDLGEAETDKFLPVTVRKCVGPLHK